MSTKLDNATDETNDVKGKMDWTLEEHNTPRKFNAMEPDVTVIVGGVKFFHYKAFLCTCEFFDKMLASKMKESESNIIEFPDRKPEEWLELYKCLDPLNYSKYCKSVSPFVTNENVEMLLPWFDYLGMEEHVNRCDDVLRKRILSSQEPPSYSTWEQYKSTHNFPRTKEAIIYATKFFAHKTVHKGSSTAKKEEMEELKRFFFDDECGDELWAYFIGRVVTLPTEMLAELDRDTIVNSPLFPYTMKTMQFSWYHCNSAGSFYARKGSKATGNSRNRRNFLDSSSESDSSEPPPRKTIK